LAAGRRGTTAAASTRRIGAEDSASRAALLDAAQALMVEEGYAAVTSRRVAARAGLKPQLVHYYFRTMDDLFLALFRRGAERNLELQADALASPQPLRALWAFSTEPAGVALTMEFAALANHRKSIRSEIAAYAEQFREQQADQLVDVFRAHGIDRDDAAPAAVLMIMSSLSRMLVMEDALGVSSGHAESLALVERWLARVEPS
jgi:AcrR family transcriptional regulator